MEPVSIASLHASNQQMKTHDWNGCHTQFLIAHICMCASECNVAFGQYCASNISMKSYD